MIRTELMDILGIEYPIFQGGMAHISEGCLAGAVSAAGGLGIIATGFEDESYVKSQVELIRSITDKPFGVNIIMENPRARAIAEACADERVPVALTAAGDPRELMPVLAEGGVKVVSVIPHVRAARKMRDKGACAVVAEGMEGGGHIGKMCTFPLVRQVAEALDIPVVAAGGIADGRGLLAALMLGAAGVQMGTVFLASRECRVSDIYKEMVIGAPDSGTVVTGIPGKKECRCIKSPFTDKFWSMYNSGASHEELDRFCTGTLRAARDGDRERGAFQAGQSVGLVREIKPVKQIIQDIMAQAEEGLEWFTEKYM